MWQCRVTSLIKSQISKSNHFPYWRLLLRRPVSWTLTRDSWVMNHELGHDYVRLRPLFKALNSAKLDVYFSCILKLWFFCVGCCRSANYHRFWLARELFWINLHLKNRWTLKEIRFTQINISAFRSPTQVYSIIMWLRYKRAYGGLQ